MEVNMDYEELKATIDRAKVRNGHQFEYQDRTFNVFTTIYLRSDVERGVEPIFWRDSSSLGDYDIYIATNVVRKEFRKPVLLHETLEAFLQEGLREEFDFKTALDIAHEIALGYDKKYARETLNDKLFKEYLQLKERLT